MNAHAIARQPLNLLLSSWRAVARSWARPAPALEPYHQPEAPLRHALRKFAVVALIILIGMIYGFLIAIFPAFLYLYLALPIGLLALFVIWALPETDNAPTGAIRWLFFAIVATVSLWPNYLAIVVPPLPWVTFMRLWSIPLTLLLVISLSISTRFRTEMSEWFTTSREILVMMIIFVFLGAVTLPLTQTPFGSFNRYLISQFEWTSVFFAACFVFRKPGSVLLWAKIFCGCAIFLAVSSVIEYRNNQVPWANHIPPFLKIESELVQDILRGGVRSATGRYRVQSIFATSLNFAEFLALSTPFTLHFLIHTKRAIVRWGLLAYIPFLFWIILLTDSRLGMVGFFASILGYGFLWSYKRWRDDKTSIVVATVVYGYPAIVALFLALSLVWRRLEVMVWGGGPQQASNDARELQWIWGMRGFKEWPIGYGNGEAARVVGWTNQAGELSLDSYYLTILLDYGLIGFIAYFGMFAVAGWKSFTTGMKSKDQEIDLLLPMSIMIGVFILIKSVLSQDDNHTLMFMALGAVVALYHRFRIENGTQN